MIRVGEKEFLLTGGRGQAVHLTRVAGSGEAGRPPFHDRRLDPAGEEGRALRDRYAVASLTDSRWARTTLCGRHWVSMETDLGKGPGGDGEDSTVPTCRSCLALMDKLFPEPELDRGFPLVVQVIGDTVVEYGAAEITGVPGDHHAALRKEVRAEVRKRTGRGLETHVHESTVVFMCRVIYDRRADEHARMVAQAITKGADDPFSVEQVKSLPPPRRLSWDAWRRG